MYMYYYANYGKCNRPKLFMITGQNGLYFLLRLGRLSYAIGFQSETLQV